MLLISDANILIDIDIDVGGLLAPMFSMDYRFGVPDLLYIEELSERHADLSAMGLELITLDAGLVAEVIRLVQRHKRPSRIDLFALGLAMREACPLLTGDKHLREAAAAEGVEVRGTLWLVTEMARTGRVSTAVARAAYRRMSDGGRRLPWHLAEQMLAELDRSSRP